MTENLLIHKGNKEDKYKTLLPQIAFLLEGENDLIAAMANVAAALNRPSTSSGSVFTV